MCPFNYATLYKAGVGNMYTSSVTPSISYKIQKTCCSIFKYAITTFISIFRYAQTAAEPFHISKACIEPSSLKKAEGQGLTSVYLESESEEFLLCTLSAKNLNENLDLNFNKGEKICVRAEVSRGWRYLQTRGPSLSNYEFVELISKHGRF